MSNISLRNTEEVIDRTGVRLVKEAQMILMRDRRNASRRLSESFKFYYQLVPKGLNIIFAYAKHGSFVMNSKRNYKQTGPSRAAITSIKKWIIDKGLSVDKKLYKKNGNVVSISKNRQKEKQPTKDTQLTSFAFAIWRKAYTNKRITTPLGKNGTDFLEPISNAYSKDSTFRRELRKALVKDGQIGLSRNLNMGTIKIKM